VAVGAGLAGSDVSMKVGMGSKINTYPKFEDERKSEKQH
jgi:hypothetical protein